MKTFLFISAMLITVTINAQWYSQYGVTNMNELSEKQLQLALEQSISTKQAGEVLTGIGAIALLGGSVLYMDGLDDIMEGKEPDKAYTGGIIATIGTAAVSIGIPLWFIGKSRENTVRVHLAKFEEQSMALFTIRLRF